MGSSRTDGLRAFGFAGRDSNAVANGRDRRQAFVEARRWRRRVIASDHRDLADIVFFDDALARHLGKCRCIIDQRRAVFRTELNNFVVKTRLALRAISHNVNCGRIAEPSSEQR